MSQSDLPILHDANRYWKLADTFVKEGKFSFINYDFPLRGYVFPLIIFAIRKLAVIIGVREAHFYYVTMALVYSAFLSVIVPLFIRLLFKKQIRSVQILLFSTLAFFFHGSLFFYPLSDLIAIIFLVMGVYLVLKYPTNLLPSLLAGICLACASLVRPSYLIVFPFFIVWVLFYYLHEKKLKIEHTLIRLISIIVGIVIIYIPQIAINNEHFGTLSPLIQTQFAYGDGLFMQQLNWGIEIQKYETNVGPEYPSAPVIFNDGHGKYVLASWKQRNQVSDDFSLSFRNYVNLIFTYPLDMLIIYARHLFNGLDVVYRSVYVENVYKRAYLFRFSNYSLWFLVSLYLTKKVKFHYSQINDLLIILISILPSLVSIPTAIEIRFMFPIFLLAYALVSFWIIPDLLSLSSLQIRTYGKVYLPYFVIFVVLCFMLSTNTYVGLQYGLIE